MKQFITCVIMACSSLLLHAETKKTVDLSGTLQSIDLSGNWQFRIDREDKGEEERWYDAEVSFGETIELPASMPQRLKGDLVSVNTQWVGALYDSSYYHNPAMEKYRVEGQMKLPFFLTPDRHYVGKAWYKTTVNLDSPGMMQLYLERPHIISKVWVNNEEVTLANHSNSLSVPHSYMLTNLRAGNNTIAICIDNDPEKVCVGKDSHSVTDQTQGCWNGIVGKIELRRPKAVKWMRIYPDVDSRKAEVVLVLDRSVTGKAASTVALYAESFNTAMRHIVTSDPVSTTTDTLRITLDMGKDMLLWDEFKPQMYRLTAEVTTTLAKGKKQKSTAESYFGMRKIEIKDKMFYVNGKPIQLRGNVENCVFPNTGYPPTDLDSWLTVFRRHKEYGINHIRFHSYCPPEAAFLAADMMGIYIQPEGPSWPNHGVRLGRGEYIDTYLYDEAVRICDEYGNHPSFTFFAFGNEPAGNWVKWCNEKVPMIKSYDPRHIYAGFSVGGGWAWQPKSEFAVKAGARGLDDWSRHAPESMTDFSEKITTYNGKDMPGTPITIPFVTHEMGQWCVFPNFAEIPKYTGVNKACNLEIFRDILKDNGMESRGHEFLMASGKLQALCYKYEMERILRTPKYAGFQILSLNDYTGQGSALVGLTDPFYADKGYITAPEFREFCSQIVPLAKFPKFTYSNKETFEADLLLNQFSEGCLYDAEVRWEVRRSPGHFEGMMLLNELAPIAEGTFLSDEIPVGQNYNVGHVSVPLNTIDEAGKYTLTVSVKGTEARNQWNFWVYPSEVESMEMVAGKSKQTCYVELKDGISQTMKMKRGKRAGTFFCDEVFVTDSLDAQAQQILRKGGKVLICAAGKVTYGREVKQQFTPVFWNTSWFKMRPPHTTGIFVEESHNAFRYFPTDYHSDLQWWELVNKAQVMQFTDFPADFQPLVQSIDTWFVSRKIGMLFEANVDKGKLMMTTIDISSDLSRRLVARQLRHSLLRYMNTPRFSPKHTVAKERIAELFTKVAGEVNMFTNDSPDELKPKLK